LPFSILLFQHHVNRVQKEGKSIKSLEQLNAEFQQLVQRAQEASTLHANGVSSVQPLHDATVAQPPINSTQSSLPPASYKAGILEQPSAPATASGQHPTFGQYPTFGQFPLTGQPAAQPVITRVIPPAIPWTMPTPWPQVQPSQSQDSSPQPQVQPLQPQPPALPFAPTDYTVSTDFSTLTDFSIPAAPGVFADFSTPTSLSIPIDSSTSTGFSYPTDSDTAAAPISPPDCIASTNCNIPADFDISLDSDTPTTPDEPLPVNEQTQTLANSRKGNPGWTIASNILFGLIIVALLVMTTAFALDRNPDKTLLGLRVFRVETGSIEDLYPVGSLVLTKNVVPEAVQTSDAVVFSVKGHPADFYLSQRIVEIRAAEQSGRPEFGANGGDDTETHTFAETALVGKVVFSIPFLGNVFGFIRTYFLLVFSLVFLCLVLYVLMQIYQRKPKDKQ